MMSAVPVFIWDHDWRYATGSVMRYPRIGLSNVPGACVENVAAGLWVGEGTTADDGEAVWPDAADELSSPRSRIGARTSTAKISAAPTDAITKRAVAVLIR